MTTHPNDNRTLLVETGDLVEPTRTAPAGAGSNVEPRGIGSVFGVEHGDTVPGYRSQINFAPMPSCIRVYHRQPEVAGADPRSPRMIVPDDFMAIEPSALARAYGPSYFDDEEEPFQREGAVAVVSIDGPLMQRGGWCRDGYAQIRERFEAALSDASVGAVILKISSPGGVVAGCFSQARSMRAAKADAGKPVYAVADECAYSAAYAMACIADEIYLPREGGVGSVGVIGVLEDWTAFNEKMGIKVAVITSGKHKADGHEDVPLKADVIARYQKRIDLLARSFAELVGEARGMTPEAVLALEADCFYGDEAVRAGLANGVKTYEEVLALASSEAARRLLTTTTETRGLAAATTRSITIRRHVG